MSTPARRGLRRHLRKHPTCRVVSRSSVFGWWVHTYFEGHVAYDQWITAIWFVRRRSAERYALLADFTMGVRR